MKPKIRVLTLAVADLGTSLAFYRDGLGLPTEGILGTEFEDGAVTFFTLDDNMILALYPRESLARDANIPAKGMIPADFSIGYTVGSKEQVDATLAEAERAGARITDPPRDKLWGGYTGYFQYLDGHLWEVVWNPALI